MTAGYSSVMGSVYLQSKYIYVYITKKMSAYSYTEECWLEILYAHSAAASLKVDGVKYKGKKKYKKHKILFGDWYQFSPTSVGIITFVIPACFISRIQINE